MVGLKYGMSREELDSLLSSGARLGKGVDRQGSEYFYVYVPWERRVRRVPKHLEDYARRVYAERSGSAAVAEAVDPPAEPPAGRAEPAAGRGRRAGDDVSRELARRYAELVRVVGEKAEWWTKALTDIGFYATLAALNFARVPPEEFAERVKGFGSAEEFSGYVLGYLDSMVKAGSDAAEHIARLQDRVRELEAFRVIVTGALERAAKQRDAALRLYATAVGSMCEQCRRKLAVALSLSQLGEVGGSG